MESNFALRLIGNVWCAVLDDQVIGRFTFEGHLTWEISVRFLKEELLQLPEDVPVNKRGSMYFQQDWETCNFSQ
jgi:hypothetical protein